MTLLLASIRQNDILLTADSRATLTNNGFVTGFDDHYQKLFPVAEHPIVIGHHGENILNDKPVAEFVEDFLKQLNAGNHRIEEVADEFRTYAHPIIRSRLRSLDDPKDGCGFWIAGFSQHERQASLVGLFWNYEKTTLICDERRTVPTAVMTAGKGNDQIPAVDWHAISEKPVSGVQAYHRSLMDAAIRAEVKPNTVGGKPHELLIDREKWIWTLPAPQAVTTQP